MGSSLWLVLANIIMTELEDVIIKPIIADGTVKFYSRFVDDTLLVMKAGNVSHEHKALNNLITTCVLQFIRSKMKYLTF